MTETPRPPDDANSGPDARAGGADASASAGASAARFDEWDGRASPLMLSVLMYAGMLLLALIIRALYFGQWLPLHDLGAPPWPPLLAAVGGSVLVLAVSPAMERWPWVRELGRMVRRLFGRLSAGRAATLGLASGVAEEALFRGALQPLLGPVVATLLFAAMHGVRWWGLFALVMGVGLAALYEWGGNLWPCIVAHVLINKVNLARISRQTDPDEPDEPAAPPLSTL